MSKQRRAPVYWYQLGIAGGIIVFFTLSILMWNAILTIAATFNTGILGSALQLMLFIWLIVFIGEMGGFE